MRTFRIVFPACLLLLSAGTTAFAAWPHDPNNGNVALCTAASDQIFPTITSDGAGGAIVTWQDVRSGNNDIYVQRISAAGAPLWTAGGVALCTATGDQNIPTITSDGAGGAIVTWHDGRSLSTFDIYAQRISAAGATMWTANGVALCTAAGNQFYPTITPDGAGGAIVTWQDARNGNPNIDIFAQRISAAGAALWTADGVALCSAANIQQLPTITSDGAGGAIVAWQDARTGNDDVYAQRISAAGAALWTVNGVALSAATNLQTNPMITSDGAGGAIVTWQDYRSGTSHIYAQRISAGGGPTWTADGVALCLAANGELTPVITSDGAGGAIVTWRDGRPYPAYDIYAQRISAGGGPMWTADGVALCVATNIQQNPTITSDGAGGAIVTWQDFRGGTSYDIDAQRISAAGAPLWTADGVALSTAAGDQAYPSITSDGAGGAIVAWQDQRNGSANDIYAQRIERFGRLGNPEPVITSALDVPNDQGGKVKVAWSPSYLDADPTYGISSYWIWRSVPPNVAAEAIRAGGEMFTGLAPRPGVRTFKTQSFGAQSYSWEYVGSEVARGFPSYSYAVSTLSDSVGAGNPPTGFLVEANSASSNAFWDSAPGSGYSVDNLPPSAPAPFAGTYSAGTASLHWHANSEADLANYRLYRGTSSSFTPSPANRIGTPTDTTYSDTAGQTYWYKLSAVDTHGNESGFTTLLPAGALDVDGDLPLVLGFERPSPNPCSVVAMLRFALPRETRVTLVVYDAAGRKVREVVSGLTPAGDHAIAWDLRDDTGRAVGAGLYFARFSAEGRTVTHRFATLR
jgi:hypothetical protein